MKSKQDIKNKVLIYVLSILMIFSSLSYNSISLIAEDNIDDNQDVYAVDENSNDNTNTQQSTTQEDNTIEETNVPQEEVTVEDTQTETNQETLTETNTTQETETDQDTTTNTSISEDTNKNIDNNIQQEELIIEDIIYPEFNQEVTIDDVIITVKAIEGVFPEGATLSVEKVAVRLEKQVTEVIDQIRDEEKNVAVSYTFDIKVLDIDGNEIQPKDMNKVKVSFEMIEVQNENLTTDVYHINDKQDEITSEQVTQLETTTEENVVSVETDSFSLYTVEFTYNNKQYVLEGDSYVKLEDILSAVELSGNIESYEVSNSELFNIFKGDEDGVEYKEEYDDNGDLLEYYPIDKEDGIILYVVALKPFTSEEWLKVIIDGIEYTIVVTDAIRIDENGNEHSDVYYMQQATSYGTITDGRVIQGPTENDFTASMPLAEIYIDDTIINHDLWHNDDPDNGGVENGVDVIARLLVNDTQDNGKYAGFTLNLNTDQNPNIERNQMNNSYGALIYDFSKRYLNDTQTLTVTGTNANNYELFPGDIVEYTLKGMATKFDATSGQYKDYDVVITYSDILITMCQTSGTGSVDQSTIPSDKHMYLLDTNLIHVGWFNSSGPYRLGLQYSVNIKVVDPDTGALTPGSYYYAMTDIDVGRTGVGGFANLYNAANLNRYSEQAALVSNYGRPTASGSWEQKVWIPGGNYSAAPFTNKANVTEDNFPYTCNITSETIDGQANTLLISPGGTTTSVTDSIKSASGVDKDNTFYSGFITLANNTAGGINLKGWSSAITGGLESYVLTSSKIVNHKVDASSDVGGTIFTTTTGNHDGSLSGGTLLGRDAVNEPFEVSAATGQSVTYTMTPKSGYKLKGVYVKDGDIDIMTIVNTAKGTVNESSFDANNDGELDKTERAAYESAVQTAINNALANDPNTYAVSISNLTDLGKGVYAYTFSGIQENKSIHVEWEKTYSLTINKETVNNDNGTFNFKIKIWGEKPVFTAIVEGSTPTGWTLTNPSTTYLSDIAHLSEYSSSGDYPYFTALLYDKNNNIICGFGSDGSYYQYENDFYMVDASVYQLTSTSLYIDNPGNEPDLDIGDRLWLKLASFYDLDNEQFSYLWNENDGWYDFALNTGESITISDIPHGYNYEVYEVDNNGNRVLVGSNIGSTDWKLKSITGNNAGTITDDTEVTFTNELLHDLTISKTTVDNISGSFSFKIKAWLGETGSEEYVDMSTQLGNPDSNGYYLFTIANNQSKTITDLPHGAEYEVYEETQDGWTLLDIDGSSSTVNKGAGGISGTLDGDASHTFNNAPLYNIEVNKTVTGNAGDTNKDFEFKVRVYHKAPEMTGSICEDYIVSVKFPLWDLSTYYYDLYHDECSPPNFAYLWAEGSPLYEFVLSLPGAAEAMYTDKYIYSQKTYQYEGIDYPIYFRMTDILPYPELQTKYYDLSQYGGVYNADDEIEDFVGSGTYTFTLKDGAEFVLEDIPYGYKYEIEEVDYSNDGYTTKVNDVTGRSSSGTISEDVTLNFENTKDTYGNLKVKKQLAGNGGSSSKDFNVTVKLSDASINGTYGDMTFTNGEAKISLKANEEKQATNLPNGIGYEVDEDDYSLDGYFVTYDNNQRGNIVGNQTINTVITNTRNVGELSIAKVVEGSDVNLNDEFEFEITLSDFSINGTYGDLTFTNGKANFTLKANEYIEVKGLKQGIEYKVLEINSKGYTSKCESNNGTISSETANVVKYINTRNTGQISITVNKKWLDNNNQAGYRPESIAVTLSGDDGNNYTANINAKDDWTYTFKDLPKNKDGVEIEYTVDEEDVEGYKKDVDGFTITNTVIVEEPSPSPTSESKNKPKVKVPNTSDNFNIWIWLGLLAVALVGGGIAYRSRKLRI